MRLARYRSARDGVDLGRASSPTSSSRRSRRGDGRGRPGRAARGRHGPARPCPAAVGEPEPLDRVRLLTPMPEPPSIRDFYAFEAHVATARRSRGPRDGARLVRAAGLLLHQPRRGARARTTTVRAPGRHRGARLRARGGGGDRASSAPTCAPDDWLDVVAGFTVMNDWSARDLQRREMALGLGPGQGQGLRHLARARCSSRPRSSSTRDGVPQRRDGRPGQRRGVEPRRAGRPPPRLGRAASPTPRATRGCARAT